MSNTAQRLWPTLNGYLLFGVRPKRALDPVVIVFVPLELLLFALQGDRVAAAVNAELAAQHLHDQPPVRERRRLLPTEGLLQVAEGERWVKVVGQRPKIGGAIPSPRWGGKLGGQFPPQGGGGNWGGNSLPQSPSARLQQPGAILLLRFSERGRWRRIQGGLDQPFPSLCEELVVCVTWRCPSPPRPHLQRSAAPPRSDPS